MTAEERVETTETILWSGTMPQAGHYAAMDRFPSKRVRCWTIPPGVDNDTILRRTRAAYPNAAIAISTGPASGVPKDPSYGPAAEPEWDPPPPPWSVRWVIHNLFAHPLLVLFPPLGEWLHDRTEP